MQVTICPAPERGQQFTLTAETDADRELIDALDMGGLHDAVRIATHRAPHPTAMGYISSGMTLQVDSNHPQVLEAKAGRQAIRALRDLFRLGLAETAQYRLVGSDTANPQTQEQLSASLEQLQLMLQTIGEVVLQQRAVLQEMHCAHKASYGEKGIVAQQGGAA